MTPRKLDLWWLAGFRYWRRQWGRAAMAIAAVAGAVALGMAITAGARGVAGQVSGQERASFGSAAVQVTAAGGVADSLSGTLEQAGCVERVEPFFRRQIRAPWSGERELLLLGVDLLAQAEGRGEWPLEGSSSWGDEVRLLSERGAVLVPRALAQRHGLESGSRFRIWNGNRTAELRVRGFLKDSPLTRAAGDAVLLMDVDVAAALLQAPGIWDGFDLRIRTDASPESCAETVRRRLGGGFRVTTPETRGEAPEVLEGYQMALDLSSLAGAAVALLLVMQVLSITVAQREQVMALLHGLGADERWTAAMTGCEALVLGLVGSLAGAFVGARLAGFAGGLLAAARTAAYGLEIVPPQVEVTWGEVALWIALGTALSIAAAIPAMWQARSVPPVQLAASGLPARRTKPWTALAIAVAGVTVASFGWTQGLPLALFGCAGVFSWAATRTLRRFASGSWACALDAVRGGQGATTLTALTVTVAAMVAASGSGLGYVEGFSGWAGTRLQGALLLHSAQMPLAPGYLFPGDWQERLAQLDGVAFVGRARRLDGYVDARRCTLFAGDVETLRQQFRSPRYTGRGAVVSQSFVNLNGRREAVEIETPQGPRTLAVEAVGDDWSTPRGTVGIPWERYQEWFGTAQASSYYVRLRPDADSASVRRAVFAAVDPAAPLLVLDGDEAGRLARDAAGRWRLLTLVQVLLGSGLGALSIGLVMRQSLTTRRRELALLETLGATPGQLARWLAAETAVLVAAAFVGGIVLGVAIQGGVRWMLAARVIGLWPPWAVDGWTWAAQGAVLLAAGVAAVAGPWREVQRKAVVESLESR